MFLNQMHDHFLAFISKFHLKYLPNLLIQHYQLKKKSQFVPFKLNSFICVSFQFVDFESMSWCEVHIRRCLCIFAINNVTSQSEKVRPHILVCIYFLLQVLWPFKQKIGGAWFIPQIVPHFPFPRAISLRPRKCERNINKNIYFSFKLF